MSKEDNVAVKFVKSWRGYNPEEVAGFPADQAKKLIDGGVAEKHGVAAAGRGAAKAGSDGGAKRGKAADSPDLATKDLPASGSGGTSNPDDERP